MAISYETAADVKPLQQFYDAFARAGAARFPNASVHYQQLVGATQFKRKLIGFSPDGTVSLDTLCDVIAQLGCAESIPEELSLAHSLDGVSIQYGRFIPKIMTFRQVMVHDDTRFKINTRFER